ncbi:MAG: hypothetical protein AMXMBFR36_35910 [Acidobacteriota bacterium]
MLRTETVVGGFFLATWVVAIVYLAGWLEPPRLALTLQALFTFAAAFGWVIGNLGMLRQRAAAKDEVARLRRRRLALYLAVPAGLIALLRAMMPLELRAAAPLAGLYAFAVYAIFFFVPVLLRPRS